MTSPANPANSILDSTKKVLGLTSDYDVFDQDLIMHINSVFFTLNQLGVGPVGGYSITGPTETWDAFLGTDPRLNAVKSYVFLRVKMLFDPPSTSFTQTAMKEQIQEYEWRLNVHMESTIWTDPTITTTV